MALNLTTKKRIFLSDILEQGKTLKDIDVSKTYSSFPDENFKKPITDIRTGYFNKESQTHLYNLTFGTRTISSYAPRWIVTELKKQK